jgi:hypothetical protein
MYCTEVLKCSVITKKIKTDDNRSVEHYVLSKLNETEIAATETPAPEAIAILKNQAPKTDLPF